MISDRPSHTSARAAVPAQSARFCRCRSADYRTAAGMPRGGQPQTDLSTGGAQLALCFSVPVLLPAMEGAFAVAHGPNPRFAVGDDATARRQCCLLSD